MFGFPIFKDDLNSELRVLYRKKLLIHVTHHYFLIYILFSVSSNDCCGLGLGLVFISWALALYIKNIFTAGKVTFILKVNNS